LAMSNSTSSFVMDDEKEWFPTWHLSYSHQYQHRAFFS
jgi:hypothetical protein